MKYFIENGDLSFVSRFGRVGNFADCGKFCREEHLYAFELQDFYNFAEQLNKTNFLYRNQTNATDELATARRPGTRSDEDLELCTNVRYDFERTKWTDCNALEKSGFILKWENKFHQLWANWPNIWPLQPYQPEFVVINYRVSKRDEIRRISMQWFSISSSKDKGLP